MTSDSDIPDPYPGLRPFQPEDGDYFFGRDEQVEEIVGRLRAHRFIAVIGGSGSGKSSIVLAGVIPKLRSFAIEGTGDFWVPLVSTPGTNHAPGESPITRLARKFCDVLQRLPDEAAEAARREDCAARLRQPGGLASLVEAYGKKLAEDDGVNLERAKINFLFLLDQFEELFHPSNGAATNADAAADCRHLVSRIVERYESFRDGGPESPVCVALTMRSEHLNDCTRYVGLPEAINSTFYLTQRLDGAQLEEVIAQPALRYLYRRVAERKRRLRDQARAARDGAAAADAPALPPLPTRVAFEPELMRLLLDDAAEVMTHRDHADQLPLLQHLLFWLWRAAFQRWQSEAPASVWTLTRDDLRAAVGTVAELPHSASFHRLTATERCLENRCEATFEASEPALQTQWEAIFRSLAFKEPNTGTYTQQRAGMPVLAARLHIGSEEELRQRLAPWLQPHPYLHWDASSRTVKVAHETLIRRWARFREWIDAEDLQFQAYCRLLDECVRWIDAQQSDQSLATGIGLRRFEDEDLPHSLQDAARQERFGRLLAMDREGERLQRGVPQALPFLQASIAYREAEQARDRDDQARIARADREREKGDRRMRTTMRVLAGLAVLTLVSGMFVLAEERLSAKERTVHRGYALTAETQLALAAYQQVPSVDFMQLPLRNAIAGARLLERGHKRWVWPVLYAARRDSLDNAMMLGDAGALSNLRSVMQGAVWHVPAPTAAPLATQLQKCASIVYGPLKSSPTAPDKPPRSDYVSVRFGAATRSLVVTSDASGSIQLFSAWVSEKGDCRPGNLLFNTPPNAGIAIALTADLSDLVVESPQRYQIKSVLWESRSAIDLLDRIDIPRHAEERPTAPPAESTGVRVLPSVPAGFATDVQLGNDWLRLFAREPVLASSANPPLTEGTSRDEWPRFVPAAADSACARLDARPGQINPQVWSARRGAAGSQHIACLVVSDTPPLGDGLEPVHLGTLYVFAQAEDAADPAKQFAVMSDVALGKERPLGFLLSPDDAWLAFKARPGDGEAWRVLPASANAWLSLAKDVYQPSRVQESEASVEGASLRARYRLILGRDAPPEGKPYEPVLPTPPQFQPANAVAVN